MCIYCFGRGLSKAQYSDTISHFIDLSTSGSINRANDGTTYLLNNGLKLNVRKEDFSMDFNNAWLYGKQNGYMTNNDYTTIVNFDLFRTFPHLFYWGLLLILPAIP